MDRKISDLYARWSYIYEKIRRGIIQISNSASYNEEEVKEAVKERMEGNFAKSIEIYLDLIEKSEKISPSMLTDLSIPIGCSGKLDFAYDVLVRAELYGRREWFRSGAGWNYKKSEHIILFEKTLETSCAYCPPRSELLEYERKGTFVIKNKEMRDVCWQAYLLIMRDMFCHSYVKINEIDTHDLDEYVDYCFMQYKAYSTYS